MTTQTSTGKPFLKEHGVLALLVASAAVLMLSKPSQAEHRTIALAPLRVEGLVSGQGYLVADLPSDWRSLVPGEVEDAFLEVRTGWAEPWSSVEVIPLHASVDSIPAAGVTRDGSRAALVGSSSLIRFPNGQGRASIPLRRLAAALSDTTAPADAILIGLNVGDGPSKRWPAAAIANFQALPSGWACVLRVFYAPAIEEE